MSFALSPFARNKIHNVTLLFGSILRKHGRHFDYWNQPLNMYMRVCYLHCYEDRLRCYLVIHMVNLLCPLQLLYFHLWPVTRSGLLRARILRNGLRPLSNCLLRQLSRQQQANSSLTLVTSDGRPLIVVSQSRCLSCSPFKSVINETIHYAHCLRTVASNRIHLRQHFIDI
jgi:hypothetical protein